MIGQRCSTHRPTEMRPNSPIPTASTWSTPNPHVAFGGGGGTHFCLGANLARVEAAALVSEVLSRMKNLDCAGPVQRTPSTLINGVHSMPVRFIDLRLVGCAAATRMILMPRELSRAAC